MNRCVGKRCKIYESARLFGITRSGMRTRLIDSQRKRTEEALRDADRRKDEFLAVLGHELRNPLSAIYNAAQVMRLDGASDGPPDLQARATLESQTSHLLRIVPTICSMCRASSRAKSNCAKSACRSRAMWTPRFRARARWSPRNTQIRADSALGGVCVSEDPQYICPSLRRDADAI
jgi:signal transduction histidine kinase